MTHELACACTNKYIYRAVEISVQYLKSFSQFRSVTVRNDTRKVLLIFGECVCVCVCVCACKGYTVKALRPRSNMYLCMLTHVHVHVGRHVACMYMHKALCGMNRVLSHVRG